MYLSPKNGLFLGDKYRFVWYPKNGMSQILITRIRLVMAFEEDAIMMNCNDLPFE